MGTLTLVSAVADATSYNLDAINGGAAPDDWALYTTTLTPAQQRNGGGSTIGAVFFGSNTFSSLTETRTPSWTNGTPTASGSSNANVFNSNFAAGSGFSITLPADTNVRTAWFLLGPYNTSPDTITASLSDSSATAISNTTALTGATGSFNPFLVKISYSANSPGQTLTVNFFAGAASPQTVVLQAVAVAKTGGAASLDAGYLPRSGPGVSPAKNLQFKPAPRSSVQAVSTSGSAAIVEGADTISAAGTAAIVAVPFGRIPTPGPGISPSSAFQFSTLQLDTTTLGSGAAQGTSAVVESYDAVSAAGSTATAATAAVAEANDIVTAAAGTATSASAAILEGLDIPVSAAHAGAIAANDHRIYWQWNARLARYYILIGAFLSGLGDTWQR